MIQHVSKLMIGALVLVLLACGGEPAPTGTGDESSNAPAATGPERTPAPPGSAVFIIAPADGATVESPFEVKFGITGMEVAPAGTFASNTGHHHLLVDTELGDPTKPIPADDKHIHFGKGQTETTLSLEPGKHTLQLVLADGNHIPHDPPVVSEQITITVK